MAKVDCQLQRTYLRAHHIDNEFKDVLNLKSVGFRHLVVWLIHELEKISSLKNKHGLNFQAESLSIRPVLLIVFPRKRITRPSDEGMAGTKLEGQFISPVRPEP